MSGVWKREKGGVEIPNGDYIWALKPNHDALYADDGTKVAVVWKLPKEYCNPGYMMADLINKNAEHAHYPRSYVAKRAAKEVLEAYEKFMAFELVPDEFNYEMEF